MGQKPIHTDHRARMQQRVRENGLESLHEHEALEYLLFFAIPRKDTNALAHMLINEFGSFCRVLEASEEDLMRVKGLGPASARLLHTFLETARYYALHKRDTRKPLLNFEDAVEYVRPLFLGFQDELFYMIALDAAHNPIRTILVAKGLPNRVTFDDQALLRQAVAAHCTHALLAHNHPAGPAMPSNADLEATAYVARMLGPVGIDIDDHIIITPTDAASLGKHGRLPHYDPIRRDIVY